MKALLAAMLLIVSGCRTASMPQQFGVESKELADRALQFHSHVITREIDKLEAFLTPDYVMHFTTPNFHGMAGDMPSVPRGRSWLRQWLPELILTGGQFGTAVVHARAYGKVGITVSHYRWQGTFKGRPFRSEGFITDIWVRHENQWLMHASAVDIVDSEP